MQSRINFTDWYWLLIKFVKVWLRYPWAGRWKLEASVMENAWKGSNQKRHGSGRLSTQVTDKSPPVGTIPVGETIAATTLEFEIALRACIHRNTSTRVTEIIYGIRVGCWKPLFLGIKFHGIKSGKCRHEIKIYKFFSIGSLASLIQNYRLKWLIWLIMTVFGYACVRPKKMPCALIWFLT